MEVDASRALSVVIPAYDASPWLPSTLEALARSLGRAGIESEVVVVDDGSTDDTAAVVTAIAAGYPVELRLISQANRGRFLARWAGVEAARHRRVLLLDARVLIDDDALEYVESLPEEIAWNGHVRTDPATPLVGRFWEVPTHVFWRRYLRDPHPMSITAENYDRLPKGTGFLLVSRQAYRQAAEQSWPDADVAHLVSDDTKLIRLLVVEHPLRLDPGFAATYRPRVTVLGFLQHAYARGTFFVDSYAGTSRLRDLALLALVALPPLAFGSAVVIAVMGAWPALIVLFALAILSLLVLPALAAINRCPRPAILAYLVYVLPFGATFWGGLVRGVVVHRRAFGGRRHVSEELR